MARLSRTYILAALHDIWVEGLGIDSHQVSIDPDTNLIDWMMSLGCGIYDEVDFADIYYRIQVNFGTAASLEDFDQFLGGGVDEPKDWEREVKPTLTLGRLADWIAKSTSIPEYSAANVAGISCRPAGVFLELQSAVRSIAPRADAFAPSTLILDVIPAKGLNHLWGRLRFHTSNKLPKLEWPNQKRAIRMGVISIVGLCSSFAFAAIPGQVGVTLFIAVMVLSACFFLRSLDLGLEGNPLPQEIETFRDLAKAMALMLDEIERQDQLAN